MKVLILIPVLTSLITTTVMSMDCYWSNQCKYKYFGSKTPYENVRGDIRDSIVKPEGCEAVSIWAMMRHGKRTPSQNFARYMKNILENKDIFEFSYEMGNSSLCAQDIENIKNWEVATDLLDKPFEITKEGYQETLFMAKRIKETFSDLLEELQEKDYLFAHGFDRRLAHSAMAFVEGLNQTNLVTENGMNDYQIVTPYTTCGKYEVEVRRNPNLYQEEKEFMKSADYLNMKESVEKKLGMNFTLSNENITALYDLCRYSWDEIENRPSPWCAVFSAEDLQVLEYIDDLRHYYRNGYGVQQYSKKLGQMPLADLIRNFEQAKNGNGKKIVSYVTHATMMDMILVVLDLYKDSNPLMGAHRDVNRKWRTSLSSTFSSNMIAVLNRCSKPGQENYDYKVAFYWNEKPLLHMCDGGMCSWQEFEDIFKPFLDANLDVCGLK